MIAIFCARGLAWDGSLYMLGWAANGQFHFFVPTRQAVQTLQQIFEIAGVRAGVQDLFTLARLLSLGTFGWPVFLTVSCWFILPRPEKPWIIGPLLNLIAVIPATNFFGIGEGIIASCLLWLLFLIFTFRVQETWGAIATLVMIAICAFSYEAAFFFMACLSVFALQRAGRSTASQWERRMCLAVALIAAIASIHLFLGVVFPRSTIERSNYIVSLLGQFLGTVTAPNLPAIAGISALAAIPVLIRQNVGDVLSKSLIVGLCALYFMMLVLLIALPGEMIQPSRYFAARGLPIIFTSAAAVGMYVLRQRGFAPPSLTKPAVWAVVAPSFAIQFVFQIAMSSLWQGFVSDLKDVVASRTGVISFADASRLLNPANSRFRRELLNSWSIESLSIVLAPHGRVQSVVAPVQSEPWLPYQLRDPTTLPHVPGLDWSRWFPRRKIT